MVEDRQADLAGEVAHGEDPGGGVLLDGAPVLLEVASTMLHGRDDAVDACPVAGDTRHLVVDWRAVPCPDPMVPDPDRDAPEDG